MGVYEDMKKLEATKHGKFEYTPRVTGKWFYYFDEFGQIDDEERKKIGEWKKKLIDEELEKKR